MHSTLARSLAALGAGLTLCGGAACSSPQADAPAAPPPATSAPSSAPSSAGASPSSSGPAGADTSYRDGTYTAKGWYGGGPSSIDVELSLAQDTITAVQVTPNATNTTSLGYQEDFADAAPEAVIGRDVDEVQLDRLAGSSSTPDGFNDALRQIRDQARA